MPARVVLDQAAIAAVATDPQVVAGYRPTAEAVADRMAQGARSVLGGSAAGPDSIHPEPSEAGDGFDVSWTEDHFYLSFAELGTEHEPARPFARPAADEFNARRT